MVRPSSSVSTNTFALVLVELGQELQCSRRTFSTCLGRGLGALPGAQSDRVEVGRLRPRRAACGGGCAGDRRRRAARSRRATSWPRSAPRSRPRRGGGRRGRPLPARRRRPGPPRCPAVAHYQPATEPEVLAIGSASKPSPSMRGRAHPCTVAAASGCTSGGSACWREVIVSGEWPGPLGFVGSP